MKNEQLLNNLIEKKAQLEKELAAINEMIKLEEAKAAAPKKAAAAPTTTFENATVETMIEEKQTSKGTEYIHTVIINGKKFTRKSKKKYSFVTLIQATGSNGIGIYGYASTVKTAESNARSWEKNSGKARVVAM